VQGFLLFPIQSSLPPSPQRWACVQLQYPIATPLNTSLTVCWLVSEHGVTPDGCQTKNKVAGVENKGQEAAVEQERLQPLLLESL